MSLKYGPVKLTLDIPEGCAPENMEYLKELQLDGIDALFYALIDKAKDAKVIQRITPDNKLAYEFAETSKDATWEKAVFSMLTGALKKVEHLQDENQSLKRELVICSNANENSVKRIHKLGEDAKFNINNLEAKITELHSVIAANGAKLQMYDNINMTQLTQANNDLLIENESLRASNSALRGVITRMKPKSKRAKAKRK